MRFYELFVGFRYLKSKKSQGFISFNTILSMGIVFIGVFILIVVTSVMNGFQVQIKDKILDVDSHISVINMYGDLDGAGVRNYRDMTASIKEVPGVRSVDPYIDGQGLLRYRENITYVMIRGVGGPGGIPGNLRKFVIEPEKTVPGARGIYIGHEMSKIYSIDKGDTLELIVPKGRLTAREGVAPGLGRYRVLGFFKTGYYDYDTKLILMSLGEAQKLFEVGDIALGLGIKLDDVYSMNEIAARIQSMIGFQYVARTAEEKNHNLFYALRLEKLIMTIILFLVIVSAGFTIMGTLAMVVMEKRKAVGILKSMGARPSSIMIIFILEGFLIGLIGSVSGLVIGLAAAINLEEIILWIELSLNVFMSHVYQLFSLGTFYKITIVPTSVYYIDSIPTEVEIGFVTFIAIFAVFLSTVAAIFPAWQASRLKPVETMRYE
ncbi:MAG TPA: ABC transporter permease [Spirochaetota bacterium]|nr:ABC transporter permease [Spirochaetota bacterium]HPR47737.1 ABC transporter permease [Spirochaetota bacterium]